MNRRGFLGTLLGAAIGAAFAKLPEIPCPATSVKLMGYRGYQYMEAGLFYCPYIPLQMSNDTR